MADFVTLTCLSCGGKLEITKDIDRFACGYCGNEQIVKRSGGIVSLALIADDIKSMKTGVDKTAAELAIPRIKKEIEELESFYSLKKYQILSSQVETSGYLKTHTNLFVVSFAKLKCNKTLGLFNFKENAEIFKSLSYEDIDFCVEEWKTFWKPKGLEKIEIKSLFDFLASIKKLKEERDNKIHEKQAQLEKLLQTANSD
jgi:DNA-directed RNA polymerase subunit RPC12/RpoP